MVDDFSILGQDLLSYVVVTPIRRFLFAHTNLFRHTDSAFVACCFETEDLSNEGKRGLMFANYCTFPRPSFSLRFLTSSREYRTLQPRFGAQRAYQECQGMCEQRHNVVRYGI